MEQVANHRLGRFGRFAACSYRRHGVGKTAFSVFTDNYRKITAKAISILFLFC